MKKLIVTLVTAACIMAGCSTSKPYNTEINHRDYVFDPALVYDTESINQGGGHYSILSFDKEGRVIKEEVYTDYYQNTLIKEIFRFYNADGSYTQLINANPGRETQNLTYNFFDSENVLQEYYICIFRRPLTYMTSVYGKNDYDKNGKLITTTEYRITEKGKNEIYRGEYSYDSRQLLNKHTAYSYGQLLWEDIYTYRPDKITRSEYTDGAVTKTSIRPAFYDKAVEQLPDFPKEFVFDDSKVYKFEITEPLKNYYDRQGRVIKRERRSVETGGFYSTEYYIYNDDGSYTEKTILTEDGKKIKFTLFDTNGLSYAVFEYELRPAIIDEISVYRWNLKDFSVKVLNEKGHRLETTNYSSDGIIKTKEVWEYNRQGLDTYYARYGRKGKLEHEKITQWHSGENAHGREIVTKINYSDRDTYEKTIEYYQHELKDYYGSQFLISKRERYKNEIKVSENIYSYNPNSTTTNHYDTEGNITDTYTS